MIKVKNNRKNGALFHYAHFICDCLFPEIINDIHTYKEVLREKSIKQSIGNFNRIYEDVMMIKNTELLISDFNKIKCETISYENKELYSDRKHFDKFTNYIFSRFEIKNLDYDLNYPEILLAKRHDRVRLIDDEYLSNINANISNGKERREINNLSDIEIFLKRKYKDNFKSLYFELISFEEQVKHFNNARLIICAHGAVLSNMLFCKEKTKIIEVTCGKKWEFFDIISNILKLNHLKCHENNFNDIKNLLE